MKIAFFRVVTVLICMKKTVGEWDDFSYKKLWCGVFLNDFANVTRAGELH